MDSAGWMRADDLLMELNSVTYPPFNKASILHLAVVAATGPKGRIQLGAWMAKDGTIDVESVFIRANQGHSIGFVREDRIGTPIKTSTDLISRVVDLWHATEQSCIKSILTGGILPGGALGGRNSVYLSPVEPWHEEFKNTARNSSNYFVQIDPVVLMDTAESDAVVQTANSNILVRGKVPPKAIIKILTLRANKGYVHVWHRELADQLPSSAGPSKCKSTAWYS